MAPSFIDMPRLKTIMLGDHVFEEQEVVELSGFDWWIGLMNRSSCSRNIGDRMDFVLWIDKQLLANDET